MLHTVNVGNIGNIGCESFEEARKRFKEYVEQSKSEVGRAGGEDVYLLADGEIISEFVGSLSLRWADMD